MDDEEQPEALVHADQRIANLMLDTGIDDADEGIEEGFDRPIERDAVLGNVRDGLVLVPRRKRCRRGRVPCPRSTCCRCVLLLSIRRVTAQSISSSLPECLPATEKPVTQPLESDTLPRPPETTRTMRFTTSLNVCRSTWPWRSRQRPTNATTGKDAPPPIRQPLPTTRGTCT